jgi:hypothetical protein
VIRIAITAEAYAAIAETMPVGSVAAEPSLDERGRRLIWRSLYFHASRSERRGDESPYASVF